ncbi:MAG: hypothetical protein O3A49_05850 [Candidatus Marinimicrobia bacterium]|nr:hypothetical protein [Candidatus Neomarinimicrobiota bacterium]
MNSIVLKILKTIASVSVAFISFTIIVIIAFYFYLSDGVEFNLNKSNQTLSSLINRFEIDFNKNSSIYFKAREENIDTYITLENAIIKRSGKILINSENITLNTTLDFSKTLQFLFEIILNNNTDLNLINPVSIKLKNPILDLASIENQDTEINKSERYFPVTIKAENGNLIDGDIEIGQFDFFLNVYQYSENSSLEKYKFRLKSSQNFPVSYIAQFFQDIESIGDKKETVSFDLTLEDEYASNDDISQKLNGVIQIRNTTMRLKKFPVQLKPEPIRRLNLDLNINDNIGQANLVGTLYNPKKSLGLQTEPNLQIGGTLNFEEILKPELNLIVNGYDIYFAKLENLNLNGVTDLTVSIIGKNVLDLQGSLKIKKSNGFLVPLADTEFETKHRIRNIDEDK